MGAKAPDFVLHNENNESVKLSLFQGRKVILYFYPRDHTPGCTQESCDFRDHYADFRDQKVEIFGISKDSVKSHLSFQQKQNLPFSLLADVDGTVCEAYGVWKEKSMYGKSFMGIERTTVVIAEDGTVERVYPKVSVSDHVATLLEDLKNESESF